MNCLVIADVDMRDEDRKSSLFLKITEQKGGGSQITATDGVSRLHFSKTRIKKKKHGSEKAFVHFNSSTDDKRTIMRRGASWTRQGP